MPQFGASLPDDSIVIIYDHNMITIHNTSIKIENIQSLFRDFCFWIWPGWSPIDINN